MKKRLRARFRLSIVVQVGLLLATSALLAWTLLQTNHIAIPAALLLLIGLQVAGLLASVQSHVETLEEFFAAVTYEDFTRHFIADDLDAELKDQFNLVLERFADARAERDVQASYLETVVRHVPVP
ncbi:MAG: histidine kinase, partial [Pseudomonadota bacterium]